MRVAILGGLLLCWCGCAREVARDASPASVNGDLAWEVVNDHVTVRVTRPALRNERFDAETAYLKPDDPAWQRYLVVVCGPDPEHVPPLMGAYRRDGEDLVFTSRFPLSANVIYWVYFDPSGTNKWQTKENRLEGKAFHVPGAPRESTTTVRHVYPTTNVLPENQLKLYLHFSAPMSQGEAYRHVHLYKENGEEIKYPFLELGEELWDASGQRFTLFFDPGRVKRGLKPREEMGPALETGHRYVFVVDAAWRDAAGNPLQRELRKTFTVVDPDDAQPDVKTWQFTWPRVASTDPLVVTFPEPLDHALLHRVLQVKNATGAAIPGKVAVSDEEKRWEFTPAEPWSTAVKYELYVETFLEDLAGNSIAKPFEVDLFKKVDQETKPEMVKLPITLR